MMNCPQCGRPMIANGTLDTPPIRWQLAAFRVTSFTAARWTCLPCFAMFDYAPDGRLFGRVGTMDYERPTAQEIKGDLE